MPSTRHGITFDENGVCAACQSYENRKNKKKKKRWQELEALCSKYRVYFRRTKNGNCWSFESFKR